MIRLKRRNRCGRTESFFSVINIKIRCSVYSSERCFFNKNYRENVKKKINSDVLMKIFQRNYEAAKTSEERKRWKDLVRKEILKNMQAGKRIENPKRLIENIARLGIMQVVILVIALIASVVYLLAPAFTVVTGGLSLSVYLPIPILLIIVATWLLGRIAVSLWLKYFTYRADIADPQWEMKKGFLYFVTPYTKKDRFAAKK